MAHPSQYWGLNSNVTSLERPSPRNLNYHSITHPVSLPSTQYHLRLPLNILFSIIFQLEYVLQKISGLACLIH